MLKQKIERKKEIINNIYHIKISEYNGMCRRIPFLGYLFPSTSFNISIIFLKTKSRRIPFSSLLMQKSNIVFKLVDIKYTPLASSVLCVKIREVLDSIFKLANSLNWYQGKFTPKWPFSYKIQQFFSKTWVWIKFLTW